MRIAITQRVDVINDYNETRDGLDQRWVKLLDPLGLQLIIMPNSIGNVREYYHDLEIQGLILTGGNDLLAFDTEINVSEERDRIEKELFQVAMSLGHPILGVCRGMQYMSYLLGETLMKVQSHVSTRHLINYVDDDVVFPNKFYVNSYHSWGLKELASNSVLKVLARSDDGVIESIKHKNKNIYGIMWHPERETPFSNYDERLIKLIFLNE